MGHLQLREGRGATRVKGIEMGKNLAAFRDRCKRITWVMLLCGIAFVLFGMMASADASSAYGRYSSS